LDEFTILTETQISFPRNFEQEINIYSNSTISITSPTLEVPKSTSLTNSTSKTCKYKSYSFPLPSGGLTNKKIFLLKTPKTGGSTFAGILRGIADNYNLNVINPEKDVPLFKKVSEIEKYAREINLTANQIDILCNHMEYNTEVIEQILGPEYFKVALFREPISRTLSGYYHSRIFKVFCSEFSPEDWPYLCSDFHVGLGSWFKDRAQKGFIFRQSVQNFDHIIVSDLYTESLLVFMHKMNLKVTDLLYISSKSFKIPDEVLLTPEQIEKFTDVFKRKHALDFKMYHKIRNQLLNEYESLPEHFSLLRQIFEDMLKEVQRTCTKSSEDLTDCYWSDNGCAKTCIKNWIKENVNCE